MIRDFGTPSRCSAAGVTTVAILVVILAMGASTLFKPATAPSDATAGVGTTRIADSHHQPKKS